MNINDIVLNGYENTKLYRFDALPKDFPNTVLYKDLAKTQVSGILKANYYVDGKLTQVYSKQENHVGVVAATRLGKTSSYVIPTIVSFARQKKKRSLIISDPKGELYRITAATLKEEGYDVKLINFRDYIHSECWNPLTPIFRKYMKACNVAKQVSVVQTDKGERNCFQGKIYTSQRELDADLERMGSLLIEEVGNDIDSMAQMLVAKQNNNDPYWDDSARELLKAYLWAMLEDALPAEGVTPITEETYSFSTIINIMNSMNDGGGTTYEDNGYFSKRGANSRAYMLAKNSILENATTTRRCIVSEFNSKIAIFKDCAMRLITSCNTFEMDDLTREDKPIAVYIDYRDELKTNYQIISLFIQSAYNKLIEYANSKPNGMLDTPFYFICDEFGNFPRITDFETVISACGGRNIFFILILQSYAQLNNVYGKDIAEIIRDNLNVHVFIGSNNPPTLEAFSSECGQLTRISPLTALNGGGREIENYQIETIPLMPKSVLSSLVAGECVITEANCGYVLFSRLERYFTCEEFKNLPKSSSKDYVTEINPLDKKYTYVPKRRRRNPYDF